METIAVITLIVACVSCVLSACAFIAAFSGRKKGGDQELKRDIIDELRTTRSELSVQTQTASKNSFETIAELQRSVAQKQDVRISELSTNLIESQRALRQSVANSMSEMNERIRAFSEQNEKKLEGIRASTNESIRLMIEENGKKLDEMRNTVDEKLQKTLEERLQRSFSAVSEQLEKVYQGLGEMKTVAADVGDLKKVLSNVKTRGTLGEYQLGAILEQVLSPEQYDANVATVSGSSDRVEYAIRLPGDGEEFVYLPIDAKFPADIYQQLLDAREKGDADAAEAAGKQLESRIRSEAKSINSKYVSPPATTDFGILFLPFEGLYAEVVQRGLVEVLQRESKIMIAGPTTMAALLNSLQMGFRTLAIKKHTSEVWNALAEVKTEFGKFGSVLKKTQERLDQARGELESLVGTRTRKIQLRLDAMTKLGTSEDAVDFGRAVALIEGDDPAGD
ncbi:MAG: DNA recombination protein RmuC [Clostridia bacterium]|nr:DNA recombination protein RmuC [Clostridia bacterium]